MNKSAPYYICYLLSHTILCDYYYSYIIVHSNCYIFKRNERREREQRELARLAAQECTFGSDEGLSRISAFHSFTDSDTYTQVKKIFFLILNH